MMMQLALHYAQSIGCVAKTACSTVAAVRAGVGRLARLKRFDRQFAPSTGTTIDTNVCPRVTTARLYNGTRPPLGDALVPKGFSLRRVVRSSLFWLLPALALAGCDRAPQTTAQAVAPLVGVMTVEARDVPVTGTFVGQTSGSRAVQVRAQVSGILVSRDYDEGSFVKKGQLLFRIEPDTYKAALEQAEGAVGQAQAAFTQAQRNLRRIRALSKQNAVSQSDLDNAEASYDSAKADLFAAKAARDKAKIELDYAYVMSPIDGYASQENFSVGNLVSAGSSSESLLTVVNQVNPIYANFAIPSPKYMRMRTLIAQGRLSMDNIQAHIALADGSVYPQAGAVQFIDKAVNPNTSVVSSRAIFANPDLFVLPGQFVRVTISGPVLRKAMLIPQKAVIQTGQGSVLMVVTPEGKAEARPVRLSDALGEDWLLEEGLTSGERIVVEGTNKVVPGSPVRIDPALSPTPSREADLLSPPTAHSDMKTQEN